MALAPDHRDAYLYLISVRETFRNEPTKFDEVMQVMSDYNAYGISAADISARMQEILKDHPKLLLGFSVFIHEEMEFRTTPRAAIKGFGQYQTIRTMVGKRVSPMLTLDHAVDYMTSVKEAFYDEPAKYKEFIKLLFTTHTDAAKVEELMKGHRNLLMVFSFFVSD